MKRKEIEKLAHKIAQEWYEEDPEYELIGIGPEYELIGIGSQKWAELTGDEAMEVTANFSAQWNEVLDLIMSDYHITKEEAKEVAEELNGLFYALKKVKEAEE